MTSNKKIYFTKTNDVGIVLEDEEEDSCRSAVFSEENNLILEEIYLGMRAYIKNSNIPVADKFSFGDLQVFVERNF